MKLRLTLAILVILVALGVCKDVKESRAFMVWDSLDQKNCPLTISPKPNARLEAPLKDDGQPDMSRALVVGVVANFKPECGKIEIRK